MPKTVAENLSADAHEKEAMHLIEMAFSNRTRVLFGEHVADQMLEEAQRHSMAARVLRTLDINDVA